MRTLVLLGLLGSLGCGRSDLLTSPPAPAATANTDPATLVTGSCSSWSLGTTTPIRPPDDAAGPLFGVIPAGQGALLALMSGRGAFGVQFLHVDVSGRPDEDPPPVVEAPYQSSQQFQVSFAVTNSHGHGGVARYEQRRGFAFTPIDLHGVATGPEVQLGDDPNDGFAHDIGLYSTPTGFLELDPTGSSFSVATRLDFSGAVEGHVEPLSMLRPHFANAVVLDDGSILAFEQGYDAPAIAVQATSPHGASLGAIQALDANAETRFPFLAVTNAGGTAIATLGTGAGMSVLRLNADGSPDGGAAVFQPAGGNCWTAGYAHGGIVCVTQAGWNIGAQVFGYDGAPVSPPFNVSLPDSAALQTARVVPTATGALVFVDSVNPNPGNDEVFAIELSCAR